MALGEPAGLYGFAWIPTSAGSSCNAQILSNKDFGKAQDLCTRGLKITFQLAFHQRFPALALVYLNMYLPSYLILLGSLSSTGLAVATCPSQTTCKGATGTIATALKGYAPAETFCSSKYPVPRQTCMSTAAATTLFSTVATSTLTVTVATDTVM
jgi:hypothetical protein